jgi:ATP-dependent helicase/nuclease subunit B
VPPLLEVLAELCRTHPLREKIVVVPSLAIGHQIGDALARAGTDWVNLRFETTRTIADAVAGFELAREGWTVLSRAQALAILERACDRVLDDASYFAELRGRPGLYRAIQKSIDDLRHAGLRELPASAFEDPRKARDLSRILGAYDEELAERKFVDRFGVLARALRLAESGRVPWRDSEWIVGELQVSASEARLVELVARKAPLTLTLSPQAGRGEGLSFVRAVGEENEVRNALRRAEPFDDAEIIYTTRDPYLALAYELTAEHAIPATFAEGISTSYTRPGQAVLGFLRWIADDYDAAQLQRVARAGAIVTHSEALPPVAFARVLREARIGWGRARYAPRIEAMLVRLQAERTETDSETRIAGIDRRIARGREALVVVRELLAITEDLVSADTIESGQLARATLRFLDRFAATRNEIDGMALAALRRMLQELTRLPEARAARATAIERLREAVSEVHVGASNPRPGHLHVATVRSGGWSGRTNLFVVGLDDAKHPGSGLQDPVVLDAERVALNGTIHPHALDLLGDAPSRASAQLRSLLARAPDARWTLSWSELDLRERRAGFPARDVLEVFRDGRVEGTHEELVAAARPAGFLEAEAPLSLSEWALADRFVRLVRRPNAPAAWQAARESDALTEFDGRIRVDPGDIDPRLTDRIYSASQLEKMARCPFGWFVERVLKIEPLEELERVQDQWLDPRQFGTLVHEVLERTMRELAASAQAPSLAQHAPRMNEIAEERLAWWRTEVPPGTETAYARQADELRATCEIFLRTEERLGGRIVPRFFELAFGANGSFAIALGEHSVKLRGSIDRVDQDTGTGDWEVWDYKTGGLFEYHDAWDLKGGTKLQHVIYARALEQVLRERSLDGRVQCSGYYFPTTKGGGERAPRTCAPGALELALNRLFDVVGSGFFPQPDEGRCSFCPYPDICGNKNEVSERMHRKQSANADEPAVRAWRELQEMD